MMMKSKINNLYSIIIVLFVISGCEDILVEEPLNFLSQEKLLTVEGAEAVLKGVYEPMQGYYESQFFVAIEYQNDFMITRGSRYPHGIYNLDTRNIGRMDAVYTQIYSGIVRANQVISSFPTLDLDEDLKGQWVAEAKVIRALSYFNLVRCWGGVPLRLEPLEDLEKTSIPRSTVSEVYDQIILDLSEAINSNYLPENYSSSDLGRVSIHAARILLADVYLANKNWSEAASMANQVINSGAFQLEPDMYKMYSPESGVTHSGDIWSIKYGRVDGIGASNRLTFAHANGIGYASIGYFTIIGITSHPILANWDDNDLRKQLNLYDTDPLTAEGQSLSAAVPMLFKKYIDENPVSYSGHGNDFPLYRYADALLIFAEADCQDNNGAGAEAYEAVNKIRRRAYGLDQNSPAPGIDLVGLSKDQFIEAVWTERAHEFMMEGKRWFDLTRMGFDIATQKVLSSGDPRKSEFWGPEDMLYPIPRQEIDNNDLISDTDQNAGW